MIVVSHISCLFPYCLQNITLIFSSMWCTEIVLAKSVLYVTLHLLSLTFKVPPSRGDT